MGGKWRATPGGKEITLFILRYDGFAKLRSLDWWEETSRTFPWPFGPAPAIDKSWREMTPILLDLPEETARR
jgi:hypothetical protein